MGTWLNFILNFSNLIYLFRTGFKKVNTDKKCPKCGDQEEDSSVRIREICSECSECLTCAGERVVQEEKKIEINIEKGMRHRQQIAFTGLSNQTVNKKILNIFFLICFNQAWLWDWRFDIYFGTKQTWYL